MEILLLLIRTKGYKDGDAKQAKFRYPSYVCLNEEGDIIVTDRRNKCIRKIRKDGIVETLLKNGKYGYGDETFKQQEIFDLPDKVCFDGYGNRIRRLGKDGYLEKLDLSRKFQFSPELIHVNEKDELIVVTDYGVYKYWRDPLFEILEENRRKIEKLLGVRKMTLKITDVNNKEEEIRIHRKVLSENSEYFELLMKYNK
jgi:hypothetical protein